MLFCSLLTCQFNALNKNICDVFCLQNKHFSNCSVKSPLKQMCPHKEMIFYLLKRKSPDGVFAALLAPHIHPTSLTCSSLLRRPLASPMERMTPGRASVLCPNSPGPLVRWWPYGWEREYGLDMEVMTVGCTIHCRSWLVVIALMVGMKALLEPGMSTLYFWKQKEWERFDERGYMITSEGIFHEGGLASICRRARLYADLGQCMQLNPISILVSIHEPCLISLTAQSQTHTATHHYQIHTFSTFQAYSNDSVHIGKTLCI